MKRQCELCEGQLLNHKGKRPAACTKKSTKVVDETNCWLNSGNSIKKLCATSVGELRARGTRKTSVVALFSQVGKADEQSDKKLDDLLRRLTPFERQELLDLSVSELQRILTLKMDKLDLDAQQLLRTVELPKGLCEEFHLLLTSYQELLIRRYNILIEKKHNRSPDYVIRSMYKPVSFCVFLNENGVTTWGQVGNSELASFLESSETKLSTCLKRFIKYAQTKRNPFKKVSERKPRRGGGAIIETPRPQIVHPSELAFFLSNLRTICEDPHYLWAWFVCKMGLTVKKAYDLTLADLSINEQGRCVIRPYEAWIVLPKNIEKIVLEEASNIYPVWKSASENRLKKLRLLASVKETPANFSTLYLQNKAKILRSSAIYAMMENGHLDRVTLKTTIGVSMPTLAKLERLFSVDVHRRLDPDFIKLRNAHISGETVHE